MEKESGQIRRKALGRGGELGTLYDARTDKLLLGNIFNSKLPEDALCEIDCHKSDFKYDESNSWSTTLEKLNIEAELKLNILSGQVDIEGNGKYLKTVNKSARVDRVTLSCMYQTTRQSVRIGFKGASECICSIAFEDTQATHVITDILWGANVFATFDLQKTTNSTQADVSGKLKASITKCAALLKAEGGVEAGFQDHEDFEKNQLSIHFSGDIEMDKIPITFHDAVAMIPEIPNKYKKLNQGRGVQIEYTFSPIEEVARYVRDKLPSRLESTIIMKSSDALVKRIEYTFDELLQESREIYSWIETFNSFRDHLPRKDMSNVTLAKVDMDSAMANFRQQLREYLVMLRTNAEEAKRTEQLIYKLLKEQLEGANKTTRAFVDTYRVLKNKCEVVHRFLELNIECSLLSTTLRESELQNQDVHVLRTSTYLQQVKPDEFDEQCEHLIVLRKDKKNNNARFILLDYDGNKSGLTTTFIQHYQKQASEYRANIDVLQHA
ncbi:unnamed protein product [Rotaria sp. Silwood2]|nr:unnamed protein product [Rotaria sp. Silwood2]